MFFNKVKVNSLQQNSPGLTCHSATPRRLCHDDAMAQRQQLVAHRGYAAAYPENTALALDAAVAAGARWLEFDLQLTRDRVPVLLHDPTFERTAGNPDCVLDQDFAELGRLDVGEAGRFGDSFAGTRVSSLEDIVAQMTAWEWVNAFVEIKRHSIERFGIAAVADAVLPLLDPVLDRCIVISFVADMLEEVRRRRAVQVGWAVRTWGEEARLRARDLQPEYLFCNVNKLPEPPEPLWQGPWDWVIYEITEPAVARELAERDVRFIESMDCSNMLAALSGGEAC